MFRVTVACGLAWTVLRAPAAPGVFPPKYAGGDSFLLRSADYH